MVVATGKVVDGKVEVDGPALAEGATVTVLAPDGDQTFELSPADEAALLAAIDEANRGDLLDGHEVLRKIAPHR